MHALIDNGLLQRVQTQNAVNRIEKTVIDLFQSRPTWCPFSEEDFLQGRASAFQNPGWVWVQVDIYHKEFLSSLLYLEDANWISFIEYLCVNDKIMVSLATYLYCILRVAAQDSVIEMRPNQIPQKISIAA